jgi:hypothetical protein
VGSNTEALDDSLYGPSSLTRQTPRGKNDALYPSVRLIISRSMVTGS